MREEDKLQPTKHQIRLLKVKLISAFLCYKNLYIREKTNMVYLYPEHNIPKMNNLYLENYNENIDLWRRERYSDTLD